MRKKVLSASGILCSLLFLTTSCHEAKQESYPVPIENIDYFSLKQKALPDILNPDAITYVLLENSEEDLLMGSIDKAMICSGRIYLMDKRLKSLTVYEQSGKGVGRVGTFGQGPKEYVDISDFDVDANGNIYVLDGRLNKVLVYDSSLHCLRETKLPFDADVLSVLPDGRLMMGLSSWNKRKASGYKIAIVDESNAVADCFFNYTDAVDPGYWISGYLISKSRDFIAYNQTIDNDVPVFSLQGELKKVFRFDFGKENVPDEDKTDVEMKLAHFDHYTLLMKILAVTDRYMVGFVWENRQKKLFVVDYEGKICYQGAVIPYMDKRQGCGFCDQGIISYEDSENAVYPDSVNEHLRNENYVLCIQGLK